MTDKEAYRIIGERCEALSKEPQVQKKMLKIAETESKEAAQRWLVNFAIATLCGWR